MVKSYRSVTGVDEFFYVLYDQAGQNIRPDTLSRIKYLQNITVEMPQEIVRAFGDNSVAELALSGGEVAVSGSFHKIPEEDKVALFGLESSADDLYAYSTNDVPSYTNTVFCRTMEDGSREYVGLISGLYTRSNIAATSKTDGVEFGSEEFTASFKGGRVAGFDSEKVVLFGRDLPGETTKRDAIFTAVLGTTYPAGGDPEFVEEPIV